MLDSGAVTYLTGRSRASAAIVKVYKARGLWPPTIPSVVLVECLQGHVARDAAVNALLQSCVVVEQVSVRMARRAALLRRLARTGSAVDALVVALAEPNGVVLTGDVGDLEALAAYATGVLVERV